jgi:CheY-like chemotaxis protein
VDVVSALGKGSRFTVFVPLVAARTDVTEPATVAASNVDPARGKLVVVIDDDALVLHGARGLLESWGCRVMTAASESAALAAVAEEDDQPDLIISDYRLSNGKTGIEVIEGLRSLCGAAIPACLISADTGPEPLSQASAKGYPLLHKPVRPVNLRAAVNQLLMERE